MKRFIAVLACACVPFAIQAEGLDDRPSIHSETATDNMLYVPTEASRESWLDRTGVVANFKTSGRPFWNVQTIQPIYQDSAMQQTVFGQGEFGFQNWEKPLISLGLGYRHLQEHKVYMLGGNIFYDHDWRHNLSNVGFGVELFGKFFTLRLNYNFRAVHHHRHPQPFAKNFDRVDTYGTLDFNFQLPFLPWATATIGPKWTFRHTDHAAKQNWRYAIRMNLAGPLALEASSSQGFFKGGYIGIAVNFGRPAFVEHSLLDGAAFSQEAFTARDLENYTLEPLRTFGNIR